MRFAHTDRRCVELNPLHLGLEKMLTKTKLLHGVLVAKIETLKFGGDSTTPQTWNLSSLDPGAGQDFEIWLGRFCGTP